MEYIITKNKNELSQRKKEELLKLAKIIQWGRRNVLDFVKIFLRIEWPSGHLIWTFRLPALRFYKIMDDA